MVFLCHIAENGKIENEYTIIVKTSQLLGLNSFGRLLIKQAAIKLMQTPSTLKYTLIQRPILILGPIVWAKSLG